MLIDAITRQSGRFVATLVLILTPLAANADNHDDTVAALRAELAALTDRIAELESKQKIREDVYAAPAVSTAPAPKASWTDKTKIKGDFRYRQESFDVDNRNDRHRQRIRARAEVQSKISDTVTVGFGLASGGDDPVSTNQTLGDGASSKSVVIDLAYANWQTPIDGMSLVAGKFKNPFHRAGGNGLIWDGDLRPEGVGFTYENDGIFANGLGLWVNESSSNSDSFLLGGQFGMDQAVSDGKLKAGIGYYNIADVEGEPVFYDGDPNGNRINPDGTYVSGFELLEGFVEYKFALSDSDVTVFADYVKNLDADDFDTGYAFGIKGKQDKWQWGYTYQELEADAVLALFTDSDFIGGGTDGEGHILQAGYALSKQISLKGTLFLNDRNIDFGTEEDFKRLMLDISFKY